MSRLLFLAVSVTLLFTITSLSVSVIASFSPPFISQVLNVTAAAQAPGMPPVEWYPSVFQPNVYSYQLRLRGNYSQTHLSLNFLLNNTHVGCMSWFPSSFQLFNASENIVQSWFGQPCVILQVQPNQIYSTYNAVMGGIEDCSQSGVSYVVTAQAAGSGLGALLAKSMYSFTFYNDACYDPNGLAGEQPTLFQVFDLNSTEDSSTPAVLSPPFQQNSTSFVFYTTQTLLQGAFPSSTISMQWAASSGWVITPNITSGNFPGMGNLPSVRIPGHGFQSAVFSYYLTQNPTQYDQVCAPVNSGTQTYFLSTLPWFPAAQQKLLTFSITLLSYECYEQVILGIPSSQISSTSTYYSSSTGSYNGGDGDDDDDTWYSQHRGFVIAAIVIGVAGFVGLCLFCLLRRPRSGIVYANAMPPYQAMPAHPYGQQQQGYVQQPPPQQQYYQQGVAGGTANYA